MSKTICFHEKCTGCTACLEACPKQCISMQLDNLDASYPVVDESVCIDCGICEKTCPNNRELIYHVPQKVWSAWSKDDEVRRTSASGGIAYELYRYWISQGGVAAGVIYDRKEGAHFVLIQSEKDIKATQNSKYTFSDIDGVYKKVKQKLSEGIEILFIGVPCQIAGLYGFLKKDYENLLTVDLICHGMPPKAYLDQHVESIEKKKKERTLELFFRDPKYYTYTYTFTLKNKDGDEFYKKRVLDTDNYQLGYHRALIYRENCYHCQYARKERISDLTIGDFSGLGKCAPCEYEKRKTSCILQNTEKGARLLEKLNGVVTLDERPQDEAFKFERQLKAPSVKHNGRVLFEAVYKETRNFETAANKALKHDKLLAVRQALYLRLRGWVKQLLILIHLK